MPLESKTTGADDRDEVGESRKSSADLHERCSVDADGKALGHEEHERDRRVRDGLVETKSGIDEGVALSGNGRVMLPSLASRPSDRGAPLAGNPVRVTWQTVLKQP